MNSNLFLRLVDEPPSLNYKTYTEGDPEGRYIEWPVNPQSRSLFVPLCTLENVRTFPNSVVLICPNPNLSSGNWKVRYVLQQWN